MMIRRLGLFILAIALSSPIGSGRVVAAGAAITGSVQAGGAATPNAVVFIQQAQGTFPPTSAATIDQRSMKFAPAVLPVVVGTTVKFLNSDPTQHNVFTPDYEKYNLGTWPQGQTKDHLFAKCAKPPCAYVQLCRIHPEMEAYVVVLQNPFFATTDQTDHCGGGAGHRRLQPHTLSSECMCLADEVRRAVARAIGSVALGWLAMAP